VEDLRASAFRKQTDRDGAASGAPEKENPAGSWLARRHQRARFEKCWLDIRFRRIVVHTNAKLIDDVRLHGLCVVNDAVPERQVLVAVGAVQHCLAVHELLYDVLFRVPHRHVIAIVWVPVDLDVALIAIGEIVFRIGTLLSSPVPPGCGSAFIMFRAVLLMVMQGSMPMV